jgi:hypothetical protein
MGEFDDILCDMQSTLSRDTIISNPSTAGRGSLPPYPPPRRANDYIPPVRNPTLPPRGSPAIPPRNPSLAPSLPPRAGVFATLPARRSSREGQEGYLESDL